MQISKSAFNRFLLFKLPAAFFCGVRVKSIDHSACVVGVRHRWINQNPFKSMYFAVQAMAAELSTGALVMMEVKQSGKPISMLVVSSKSVYLKKATGKILFSCLDGAIVKTAVEKAISTGEGQTFWMQAVGTNENNEKVATMDFEWSIKLKQISSI